MRIKYEVRAVDYDAVTEYTDRNFTKERGSKKEEKGKYRGRRKRKNILKEAG